MNEFWELHVLLAHDSWVIYLTEEIGRAAIAEWKESLDDVTNEHKFIQIEGFNNEATRPPKTHVYLIEEIKAMSLYRMQQ